MLFLGNLRTDHHLLQKSKMLFRSGLWCMFTCINIQPAGSQNIVSVDFLGLAEGRETGKGG